MNSWPYKITYFLLLIVISSCVILKASQISSSGFVPFPENLSERRERAPFGGYWESENFRNQSFLEKYHHLFIRPISTEKLEKNLKNKKSMPRKYRRERIDEIRELGRYFQERLKRLARENKSLQLDVVDKVGPNTVELVIALVEVRPTEPFINTAGAVAGFFVKGGGMVKSLGVGSVAMEGYLQDSETGDVFMQFKDREGDKTTLFTLKDFQQYAHIREAVDDWSKQIIELCATSPKHQVKDSWPISLAPY